MSDYFQSSTISLVLTWLFSIPIILSIIGALLTFLFQKVENVPKIYMIWLLICFFFFSPLSYILLQLFIATAYPFQSLSAFFSCILLTMYIPIVFGLLYAIGLGLPFLGILAIVGFKDSPSKLRLWLSALAAPFIVVIAQILYCTILPFAAYSTHWLDSENVIRATNGPAQYFYEYVAEKLSNIELPKFVHEEGLNNFSPKERLRLHVAAIYLGGKEYSYFIQKSYPDEFKKETGN